MSKVCCHIFFVSLKFQIFVLCEWTRWFDLVVLSSTQIAGHYRLLIFACNICLVFDVSARINAVFLFDTTRKFFRSKAGVIIEFLQTS